MTVLFRMNAGLILWAVGFSLIYALHGIGCAGSASWLETAMRASWATILGLHVALLIWLRRTGQRKLVERISTWTAFTGIGATAVTGMPVILPASCL